MTVSDSYPYIQPASKIEGDEHVRLKNLAVHWLLSRGFDPEDIEQEHYAYDDILARTDIYADNGSTRAFVECDAGQHLLPSSLAAGAKHPAKKGEAVYVFRSDGIYRLHYEERTLTNSYGTNPISRKVPTYTYVSELPMVDLRAYKTE